MTSVDYKIIFYSFLGNIKDLELFNLDEYEVDEILSEYLHKTVSDPYIRRLFSSIVLDQETNTITYEMKYVVDEDADREFVINILSKGMAVEWMKPIVRSKTNIEQMFGTKEQQFYSQAQHLAQIRSALEDMTYEVRKTIRDRDYINNSYLGDV